MKKRILSLVITIVLLFSVAPVRAFNLIASAEILTENGFTYEVRRFYLDTTDTEWYGTEITKYTGSAIDLVIPDTMGGYPVTKIARAAFDNCTSLQSVTIPKDVTFISSHAFRDCNALKTVNFNATYCYSNVDSGYPLFKGCDNLTTVTVGNNVKFIPQYAFMGCTALESVTIGSGVTNIASTAFYNCNSLKKVKITDLKAWCQIDFDYNLSSNPLSNNANLYLNNQLVTNLVIPEGTTEIKSRAFTGCSSIESIKIPNDVSEIGSYSFENCIWLEDIIIPKSVTTINSNAFDGCSSIKNVYYEGSKDEWRNIKFTTGNSMLTSANVIYNSANACLHTYVYSLTVIPTCFGYGSMQKKCSLCGVVEESNLPVTPTGKHISNGGIVTTKPTELSEGMKTYSCVHCGTVLNTEKIAKLPKPNTASSKPKTSSLKSVKSSKKKQVKITWGKDSKVSGYQIVYATNSKFTKGKKTITIKGYKTTSKTIKSLKSKKTYYVKVRSYKTVKGKKIYSSYSKVKKIKIK